MNYRIIFDSNIVWTEDRLDKVFNIHVKDLNDFIAENNKEGEVFVLVPEVVMEERISQNLRYIDKIIKEADSLHQKLSFFGLDNPNEIYKTKDYSSFLREEAKNFLDENKIQLIGVPDIKHEDVLERAYKKLKPFSVKDGSDKGYKDTMIWLSILEYAKNNSESNYIICTRNSEDFNQDILGKEFRERGNTGEFIVFDNVQSIKEYLDNRLSLQLDLKEQRKKLHGEIENEIRERTGSIIVELNAYKPFFPKNLRSVWGTATTSWGDVTEAFYTPANLNQTRHFTFNNDLLMSDASSSMVVGYSQPEKVGYDFVDIKIISINDLGENFFSVEAVLTVKAKNKNPNFVSGVTAYRSSWSNFEKNEDLSIALNYNRSTGEIELTYVN